MTTSITFDAEHILALSPLTLFSLRDRVALVTGAAGGIGPWIAAGLGAAGCSVLITDVDAEGLQKTQSTLQTAGIDARSLQADLLGAGAPEDLIEGACNEFGAIHILVNNAAINRRQPILDVDIDTWDTINRINLRQPFLLCQQAATRMIRQGDGGSIICMSSINAGYGLEHNSVYGSTKAGLSQLVRVMAQEWAEHGIRANAIGPGFIDTPLTRGIWEDPDVGRWIRNRVPFQRLGLPTELIGACLLLASDAGAFITGQTLYVDGGMTSGGRWFHPDR